MTKEELERLYMDIYDNGILDNDYKEKFKRYVNNRLESLEKENARMKSMLKTLSESIVMTADDVFWSLRDDVEKFLEEE